MFKKSSVMLIFAWNGIDEPFKWIDFDDQPKFEVVLFNYSGNNTLASLNNKYYDKIISERTEFKGSLLNAVYKLYKDVTDVDYIGFVDDDIQINIFGINQLIETAYANNLDAFQAAIHPDSYCSHQFNVWDSEKTIDYVNWVEIMMPFYRKTLFDGAHDFYATNISSYGIDNYAIPFYQQILGLNKTAVIHTVFMKHLKPVTDGSKIFSNGLSSRQEGEIIRKKILQMIQSNYLIFFTPQFLQEVYEVKSFRWQAKKYFLKDIFKNIFRSLF